MNDTITTSQDARSPLSPVGNAIPEAVQIADSVIPVPAIDIGAKVHEDRTYPEIFEAWLGKGISGEQYGNASRINKDLAVQKYGPGTAKVCQYLVNEVAHVHFIDPATGLWAKRDPEWIKGNPYLGRGPRGTRVVKGLLSPEELAAAQAQLVAFEAARASAPAVFGPMIEAVEDKIVRHELAAAKDAAGREKAKIRATALEHARKAILAADLAGKEWHLHVEVAGEIIPD